MGTQLSVLQKGQMRSCSPWSSRTSLVCKPAQVILLTLCALPAAVSQSITPAPQDQASQPHVTKSEAGKEDEAARAAARARNRHFDRVLIIVLENVDYERAIQDPSLAALASQGASF